MGISSKLSSIVTRDSKGMPKTQKHWSVLAMSKDKSRLAEASVSGFESLRIVQGWTPRRVGEAVFRIVSDEATTITALDSVSGPAH